MQFLEFVTAAHELGNGIVGPTPGYPQNQTPGLCPFYALTRVAVPSVGSCGSQMLREGAVRSHSFAIQRRVLREPQTSFLRDAGRCKITSSFPSRCRQCWYAIDLLGIKSFDVA